QRRAGRSDLLAGRAGASCQDRVLRVLPDRERRTRGGDVIPPSTSIGKVRLRVADIEALSEFYERVIGLRGVQHDGIIARLGPEGGEPLVELVSAPAAPPPSFSTGLFHL